MTQLVGDATAIPHYGVQVLSVGDLLNFVHSARIVFMQRTAGKAALSGKESEKKKGKPTVIRALHKMLLSPLPSSFKEGFRLEGVTQYLREYSGTTNLHDIFIIKNFYDHNYRLEMRQVGDSAKLRLLKS